MRVRTVASALMSATSDNSIHASQAADWFAIYATQAADWFGSDTSHLVRVFLKLKEVKKAINQCSDPDSARKEWQELWVIISELRQNCDAFCELIQSFIKDHAEKLHLAAPPPAARLPAAHLQHIQTTPTQLGAARPKKQAAKRANPPARSIGTREATGIPSSETNSRAGTLSLGDSVKTAELRRVWFAR